MVDLTDCLSEASNQCQKNQSNWVTINLFEETTEGNKPSVKLMFTQKSHNEHKLVRCYECVCRGSGLGLHFRQYVLLQALHGTV